MSRGHSVQMVATNKLNKTIRLRRTHTQIYKHVSGLAGLGEHAFITAIGLNQRMFWLKCLGQNSVCSLFLRAEPLERHFFVQGGALFSHERFGY